MEKSIKTLFEELGINTKRNNGSDKVLCPKCSHTRKNKKDPCLSIDLDSGDYNCHNDCGFKGRVRNEKVYEPRPKDYIKPVFNNNTKLNDNVVKWFQGRCITQTTLVDARVTESIKFMPQVSKEVNTVNFNYFREGELVNVKYRDSLKNFMMVKDAELIFYGLDNIKEVDWCVIVEGEIDALSFWEAGVKNVISVPNGASKGNANLEYLDNCIEYFNNKSRIILATDDDEPGRILRDELARRLGYELCYKVNFDGLKDANEYLKAHGPQKLRSVISEKKLIEFPLAGIVTADMIWEDVEYYIQNGLTRGDVTGKLKEFDEMVSFTPGSLMVITGIPNHGKSPFELMVMCALSVNHGYKWGLFSPEHRPLSMYLALIIECLIGKRLRKESAISSREMELAKDFINNHFYFIQPEDDDVTVDNILAKAKSLVIRYGIRGLSIDPWNKLEHNFERGDNETMYISKQLDKIIKFDQKHGVFTIVVAHPTKIKKDKSGKFEIPNLYDISGSSNWFNKVDIGVTFYRNFEQNVNEIHVQKMKYSHLGKVGECFVRYNLNNSRFTNVEGQFDNANWLLPAGEQQIKMDYSVPIKEQILTPVQLEDDEIPF